MTTGWPGAMPTKHIWPPSFCALWQKGKIFARSSARGLPLKGHRQCGYFLGHEVIKEMQRQGMSMREIGTLDDPEWRLQETLQQFANA